MLAFKVYYSAQLRHMKEFDRLIPSDAYGLLQYERSNHTDMDEYLDSIITNYGENPWIKHIKDMAFLVEPKDVIFGINPEYPAGNAFFRGALIGYRVVKSLSSPEIEKKMFQINVGIDNDDEDTNARLNLVASSILACGERGFHRARDLSTLIYEWEDELEPEVVYQPYMRKGFGLMMYLISEASELLMTEALQTSIDSGTDWDSELRELTGEA